nr:four helix bundle protein [uncultured Capnocytophaga sp.]
MYFCLTIQNEKEYNLSKQVLRSGTAICALVKESEYAQTTPDSYLI